MLHETLRFDNRHFRKTLDKLACNVFNTQVRGRHGRAVSKLLFVVSILMYFNMVADLSGDTQVAIFLRD